MLAQLQLPPPARPPDPWAVALLYLPLVEQVARGFRLSPFDTDDLVQVGMLGARDAVLRNDPARDSLSGLVKRTAYRQMCDWLRWRRKARPVPRNAAPVADRGDRVDLAELADVLAALECLTDRQRFIVREHFGLRGPARTGAVIAVALGMKRDAVARAQFRALVRVRERLGAAARGPEAARPPCVICGDPDGTIPRSRRTPERLSLARFGLDGVACRRCYIRLYARQRVRKRLGVAS